MINIKPTATGAAILAVLLFASVEAHSWWVGRETNTKDLTAQRDRGTAARDLEIKRRDRREDSLRVADSTHAAQARTYRAKYSVAETAWERAKASLDTLMPVPVPVVHSLELVADSALLACKTVLAADSSRIDGLLARIAAKDTTRAALDTNRAVGDSTRKTLADNAKPPWFARALGWISDHAVTILAAGGTGYVTGRSGK